MIELLIRLFVRDSENIGNPRVRERYGILAGGTGIVLNVCLFGAKFIAGLFTASIAVTADAFNNLSDAGSSIVTLLGFKLAGMPPDKEHPFGHGRIEYLSGLVVSLAILVVGVELLKSSILKIFRPEPVEFQVFSFVILFISVLTKLWMCHFNRTLSKRIHSSAMSATAMDSLTDAVATSAVILGLLAGHLFQLQIDGWVGVLVALFILYTGFCTAKDSLSPLLGQAPDKAFVQHISDTVMSHDEVVGIHDLIVHDYGPGRLLISLHAEVPSNADILETHDAIDRIELELRRKFSCEVTIHMDPIVVDDDEIRELHQRVCDLVSTIDPGLSIHDFRMVKGPTHTNLIFDLIVPYRFRLPDGAVAERVREEIEGFEGKYCAVIQVEKAFT